MTWVDACIVLIAGLGAGAINALVGSGTLLTFPALLAIGLPPVTANVTNTVGISPGSAAAIVGYRPELRGQRRRLVRLVPASFLGAMLGCALLLKLPESAFRAVVPGLILLGCLLVLLQPWLSKRLVLPEDRHHGLWWVWPAVFATGVYGGYFGAAQGVLLMAILGIGLDPDLQRMNAIKNVLAFVVNISAAVLFAVVADVDWLAVVLLAAGSTIGGLLGGRYGRRLPRGALRGLIVAIGIIAVVSILL